VPGEDADGLLLETLIGKAFDACEALIVLPVKQHIGGPVVGIGILDQPGALGIAHEDVAIGVVRQRGDVADEPEAASVDDV
jgi:hypothetical protein